MTKRDGNRRDRIEGEAERRGERSRVEAIAAREDAVGTREAEISQRESAANSREVLLTEREELARLREDALLAREEAREAAEARDHLLLQMREANEKLLVATVRAEQAADDANAARIEIAESEERFRSLVTTSSAVVWFANAEGRIHVDPEAWLRFTGMSVADEDEPGWGWLRAVHSDDQDAVRQAWVQATGARKVYTHQHRLRRRDGT